MATLGQMQVQCPGCGAAVTVTVSTAPLSLITNNTMTVKLQATHDHECGYRPGPGEHVCECGLTKFSSFSDHSITGEMQCAGCGTWTKGA